MKSLVEALNKAKKVIDKIRMYYVYNIMTYIVY